MVTQHGRPQPIPPLLPTLLVALLLGLLILISPSVGSWDMDARDFDISVPEVDEGGLTQEEPFEEEVMEDPTPEQIDFDPPQISPIWGQVILGLLIALVVAGVAALIWLYLRYRRSRTPDEVRSDLQVDTEIAPEEQIPVLARAATSAQEELRAAADPTDAVIRAWLALEEAAASSGMRRRPADTPTDLTMTVLERTRADRDATTALLGLFHRARFSTSPMTAADQQRAIDHLDTLARSWDQVGL